MLSDRALHVSSSFPTRGAFKQGLMGFLNSGISGNVRKTEMCILTCILEIYLI